ncbi:MAG: FixH family protein [Crocinitomicaceae bacterium]|nr:FixH family protein [Crocinitomicaceae bacterium]
MNWGKGIIVALALFVGFILFLVITLMRQDVDLVSEDYYKQEIDYEARIQKEQNGLNSAAKIKIVDQKSFVIIQLPDSIALTNVLVNLKRPNDEKLDKSFKIEGTKTFMLPKASLEKGKYDLTIEYTMDQKDCLLQQKIII